MTFRPNHQTVRRLTYFLAIADAGSIRGAAQTLGLSVPVLSTALSELEAELDVTLATRNTRQFTLTSAGEGVQAAVRNMLEAAGAAIEVAQPTSKANLSSVAESTTAKINLTSYSASAPIY